MSFCHNFWVQTIRFKKKDLDNRIKSISIFVSRFVVAFDLNDVTDLTNAKYTVKFNVEDVCDDIILTWR